MFSDSFWGPDGYEELRKHIKQGSELCKDICSVLQERVKVEANYSKSLSKLASELSRITTSGIGTLAEAWGLVGSEMETEAEQHKQLGQAINDDICKLIKNLCDSQTKTRKSIENTVDKFSKTMADRRDAEIRCRRIAISSAKDREKAYDATRDPGLKNRDKELPKLEKKAKQIDDVLSKADKDYLDSCKKLELAREEWESNVFKAASQLQNLEEERINQMQDCLNKYNSHLSVIGPKLIKSCDKLAEAVSSINVQADIQKVIQAKGKGPRQSEQVLPEYYAEDSQNTMDLARRKQSLQNYIELINQDIDREQKALDGVEKLVDVYRNRPSFADADTRDEVNQRLDNVNAMVRWLEASKEKVSAALAHFDGQPRSPSQFAQYIEHNKDKQGHNTSVLKLRSTSADVSSTTHSRPPLESRHAVSMYEEDEFDMAIGKCTAIYAYTAKQYDELTIEPGDVITIYEKLADGWWQGELRGKVGIFPSTYVEERT